jgi:uncharacterized protein (TIGR00251 family)
MTVEYGVRHPTTVRSEHRIGKSKIVNVRVVPNAKKNEIKEQDDGLKVYLAAPPVEGKANKLLIRVLAKHFGTKKSCIDILKGEKSRNKVVRIDTNS